MKKIALIFSCVLLSGCVSWGNLKRLNSIIPTVEALVLLKDRVDNGMDVGKVGTDEVSDIPEKDVDLILAIGRGLGYTVVSRSSESKTRLTKIVFGYTKK